MKRIISADFVFVVFACSMLWAPWSFAQVILVPQGNALFSVDMAANNHAPKLAGVCTGPISSIAIAPGSMIAYAATQELRDNQVCEFDIAKGTVKVIDLPPRSYPTAIAVNPNGRAVYVVDGQNKSVIPIRVADRASQTPIEMNKNGRPFDIAIDPNGETAYVTDVGSGEVTPIDLIKNVVGAPILADSTARIAVSPDGRTAYVTNSHGNASVRRIDLYASRADANPILLDSDPHRMAFAPAGNILYVTLDDGDLSLVGVAERATHDPIKLGAGAGPALAVSANGEYVFVGRKTPLNTWEIIAIRASDEQSVMTFGGFGAPIRTIVTTTSIPSPTPFPGNKVIFIGDSVTAGFGYCGDELSGFLGSSCQSNKPFLDSWANGSFSLNNCKPPEPVDNRCSNNNVKGKPWEATDWRNLPTAPRIAYSFVIAENQHQDDKASIQNWAMTGSEPRDWDPVGVAGDQRESDQGLFGERTKSIKNSYVVMTLGANPLLDKYLRIHVLKGGSECAEKTVKSTIIPPANSDAQKLNYTPDGLGACFDKAWQEIKQSEHLVNTYKTLLQNGNHVLVIGYPVVCPWSFGNWQPSTNPWSPSSGKACDSLQDPDTKISQFDQAQWLGRQANLRIERLVGNLRTELKTGNIHFAAPDESWAQHQYLSKGGSWIFGSDTWVHPNVLGHRVMANIVLRTTCEAFGHWCGGLPLKWSAGENRCEINAQRRSESAHGAEGGDSCDDLLVINPCLKDGWRDQVGLNGRSFFDSASCENYALAGGLLSQRPGAKELKGQQFCANENQLCQFPGTAAVTYGAGDKWITKTLPGPVTCRASTFSVDPTPLTMNSCYVLDTALQANNGLAFCANENQVCQFAGQLEVSYGVEDKWKKLTLNGPVSCTDSTFGDPSPGKAKNCYVKFDPADTVHRRRFCASENQLCQFPGTEIISYGTDDHTNYRILSGPVSCSDSTFGDPNSGVKKNCYFEENVPITQSRFCANENQLCQFSGEALLSYGVKNNWNTRKVTGPVSCSDFVFGDPSLGDAKYCFVDGEPPSPIQGKQFCASEGQVCQFLGSLEVSYVAPDGLRQKVLQGPVQCNAATFGSTSTGNNTNNACYVDRILSTENERFCANENHLCQFPGKALVSYGVANDRNMRGVTGPVSCSDFIFGDPKSGSEKSCLFDLGLPSDEMRLCADEDQVCEFSGEALVSYGVKNSWNTRRVTGPVSCRDSVFGDPSSGDKKKCYVGVVPK